MPPPLRCMDPIAPDEQLDPLSMFLKRVGAFMTAARDYSASLLLLRGTRASLWCSLRRKRVGCI